MGSRTYPAGVSVTRRVFWPEFWEHVQQRVAAADPMVRARRIFACYDEDGDGALDVREATAAFRQASEYGTHRHKQRIWPAVCCEAADAKQSLAITACVHWSRRWRPTCPRTWLA